MENKLQFQPIITNAFQIGLKNFASILGCIVLWLLTCWVPYVNVGTTIALVTLPAALSKGKVISPLQIFDKSYYKYMGEFFLSLGLKNIIVGSAFVFFVIPAIVVSIAYSLTTLLVINKSKGATEALKLSLELTYGYKLTIFLWNLFFVIALVIIPTIILAQVWSLLVYIYLILISVVMLGGKAYIYGQLTSELPD